MYAQIAALSTADAATYDGACGWNTGFIYSNKEVFALQKVTQKVTREPRVDEAELDTMTASKETLEDYTLRFAPRSYRK